jgi:hypothetical protein
MVAAYSKLVVDEVFYVIWLIKIRKRSSLNTVPHGMPDVTSLKELHEELTPALVTNHNDSPIAQIEMYQ